MTINLQIVCPTPHSNLLKQVIALGDRNTKTLGLLPKQAYIENAARQLILAAVDGNMLAGYVIFRYVRRTHTVKIAYFCVDEAYRRKGVADLLFNALKERTKAYLGISLLCRRDYVKANRLWQRLGFRQIDEIRGRGKEETFLVRWWYDHGHKTLFDNIDNKRFKVVIDANIFFDFYTSSSKPDSRESQALLNDELQDEIELLITPELTQEVNRTLSHHLRKKYYRQANKFLSTTTQNTLFNQICSELSSIFPKDRNENDESDLRQLAYAIADPEVDFFITRDQGLLNISNIIYQKYRLTIWHPVDLILRIDEDLRSKEYKQMRFGGTDLQIRRVQSGEQQKVSQIFQYSDYEKKSKFLDHLRSFLVERDNIECRVVEDAEKKLLVLFIYDWAHPTELRIPLFRINRSIPNKKIVRYLLLRFLADAAKHGRSFTRITETILDPIIREAIQEDTFIAVKDTWIKPNLLVVSTAKEVANHLLEVIKSEQQLLPSYRIHISLLQDNEAQANREAMSEIERLLWPAKILDADIKTISIPINHTWAALWFDEVLANQTLWGANKDRAFNREGVYYSRVQKRNIPLPGRILWYVTKDSKALGTASIRGCSRLEDIVVGSAKELYRQFRHLGIYEWQELMALAGNNENKELTAFRFSDTQLFTHPVPYETWKRLSIEETGKGPNRQSPATVPTSVFASIYKIGMNLE